MGQNDWIKKEIESELLDIFIESYRFITGHQIVEIEGYEGPDFLATLEGKRIGLEVTNPRFSFNENIENYFEEIWRIAEKKNITYKNNSRFVIPIILVLFTQHLPLYEVQNEMMNMPLEDFDTLNFSEIWLADIGDEYFSVGDYRRSADLYCLKPVHFRGFYRVGNWGRKPYG